MKNQNLKDVLKKFNSLENTKFGNMEVLNHDELSSIKGGSTEVDCQSRFKIKCQQSFTMNMEEELQP